MSDLSGQFVWYDLMTTEPEGAKKFYGDVMGWGVMPWPGPMEYDMWTVDNVPVGGVSQLPEDAQAMGAPTHWLSYVQVADVDATAARAKEQGARAYVEPDDIPEVGRFAVLADPQGAVFAIFAPSGPPMEGGDPHGVGHPTWHELMTSDAEAAWSFYAPLFGWTKGDVHEVGEGGMLYHLFHAPGGEAPIGGMFTMPPGMEEVPPNWLVYVRVAGLDAALERVKAGGGKIANGPMEVPGGDRIVQCMDPQGGAFALTEPAS